MVDENNVSNSKQSGKVGPLQEPVSLRLPGHYVMMTVDGYDKKGALQQGAIGIKSGDNWSWMSYTDMKKIIDMCKVIKMQFNSQLQKERERAGVDDL